jgi:hypothetical protein
MLTGTQDSEFSSFNARRAERCGRCGLQETAAAKASQWGAEQLCAEAHPLPDI